MALPDLISVEEFFSPPERAAATISPDGTRIAYLAPWKNRLNIWVAQVGSEDLADSARCVTADETRTVLHYAWTDDPRWLMYLQDTGGDENWHVFRVDLDDPDAAAVDLTPYPGAMAAFELPPDKPGKAIVHCNKRDPQQMDVYELDIASGELTMMVQNPGKVVAWLPSRAGELFASRLTTDGDIEILQWDKWTESLRLIARYDGADYTMGTYPMVVTPDGTGIWMGSNEGTDHTRLVRLDVATGKQTAVDKHPTLDIDTRSEVWAGLLEPLIQSRAAGELLGVRYLGERQVIRALDSQFADVLANLEKLSDGDISGLSSDDSGQKWVVSFNHDRDPGATYLYDHATRESRLLFRPHPHLDPANLAPMLAVTIPSRDGLDLPAYLTLPVGVEPRNLPLVLAVHGGPWARDGWMYAPAVQLLANRGYAVLQVNFRGSSGYGKAFVKAAIGEFAGKMHDDLIDGVNWAVEQGYADPDRVAIFGGSYGGYATLVGVTFTPDVFAAAIDYVGISSLANFIRTLPEIARPHLANNLVEALRARGVEVEYMVKADEGHGFVNPENVIDMFHAVERFLAQHLGGPVFAQRG